MYSWTYSKMQIPTKGAFLVGLLELLRSSGPRPSSPKWSIISHILTENQRNRPLLAFWPQQMVMGVPSSSGVTNQWVTPPDRARSTLQPLKHMSAAVWTTSVGHVHNILHISEGWIRRTRGTFASMSQFSGSGILFFSLNLPSPLVFH